MQITQTMLDVCEEALYHLRQDVTLPTLAAAPTDTGMEWVKCRKAFDYAASEVLSAHDWRFARNSTTVQSKVDDWPQNVRKVLVYCLARELAVQIAGRTEDLKNLHQLYNRFLFDAKLKDLEEDKSTDQVCKEVVATLRGYFSEESKDIPRSMVSLYERIGAVRQSSFEEVRAAHGWNNGATIAAEANLPPLAKAAFVALVCHKLAVACGLPSDAIGQLAQIYELKLVRARVADLEALKSSDAVVKEVVAAVRPFFSTDQKNLPWKMIDLYERVDAVKTASFEEVKAAHEWTNKAAITDGTKLPPIARQAWVTLIEAKLGVACGIPPEAVAKLEEVYLLKLNQARAVDLEASASSDPVVKEVLAGIRPYFAFDQKNLPLTMVSLYERIGAVKESAYKEILAVHNWRGKEEMTGGDDLPPQARAAWIALMQQKLCIACGLSPEAAASFESIWRAKVKEARVSDLETTEVPKGIAGEVLTLIRDCFDPTETNLPMDLKTLAARVERMKPIAMKEVLSAHPWGFAMEEDLTRSGRLEEEGLGEYVWWIPVPGDCMKIVGVYGRDGELLKWERVSGQIRAYGEICRVTYVRRVECLADFSPDAYRLVVLRLAADMSRAMSMRTSVQNLHENIYRDALAEAKTRDTRQSNPGPEVVWGGNYYVDRMTGRRV